MSLVVDVQCFKLENNKFLVKEFAGYDGAKIFHYVFKPPFNRNCLPPNIQKQVAWLINNHHCIGWNEGHTPAHLFPEILRNMVKDHQNIYVKGLEKARFLEDIIGKPVIVLEDTPALQMSEAKCFCHRKNPCMCALSNVYFLYEHFFMQ